MRAITALLLIFAFQSANVFSQEYCRYPNLFSEKKSGIKKFANPVYKTTRHYGKTKKLRIQISMPKDKYLLKKRPLVIGVHGGGFMDICPFFGCYKYFSVMMNEQFTKRGFISASIEYRLHPRQKDVCAVKDRDLVEVHYLAAKDVRDSIVWLKKNADKYGIDSDNIFLMGNSAGASTVMNAAFLDESDLAQWLVTKHGMLAPRPKIKAVLAYSGALYDLSYIDPADKTSIFFAHGLSDTTVPIDTKPYFGCKNHLNVNGSRSIARRTRSLGFETDTYFFRGGHNYTRPIQNATAVRSVNFLRRQIGC